MLRDNGSVTLPKTMPVLSAGLRSRVLAAALEAREKRARGRRTVASALTFFALAGWAAWTAPQVMVARHATPSSLPAAGATLGDGPVAATAETPFYSRYAAFIAARGDDWGMIEAEFQLREKFLQRMPM